MNQNIRAKMKLFFYNPQYFRKKENVIERKTYFFRTYIFSEMRLIFFLLLVCFLARVLMRVIMRLLLYGQNLQSNMRCDDILT